MSLIPYPIPPEDRRRLMEAGREAVQALHNSTPAAWKARHARVEEIIASIVSKYAIQEDQ